MQRRASSMAYTRTLIRIVKNHHRQNLASSARFCNIAARCESFLRNVQHCYCIQTLWSVFQAVRINPSRESIVFSRIQSNFVRCVMRTASDGINDRKSEGTSEFELWESNETRIYSRNIIVAPRGAGFDDARLRVEFYFFSVFLGSRTAWMLGRTPPCAMVTPERSLLSSSSLRMASWR